MKYLLLFSISSLLFLSALKVEAEEDPDYFKCVEAISLTDKYCHVDGYNRDKCAEAGRNLDRYCKSGRNYP